MLSEENISKEAAAVSKEDQQNVVTRVANLPLVSSTYDMVSSAYTSTKETHPYLKSVCDVAEKSVKTLTAAAVSGAQPLLTKLEPQIATANEYACKSLDKLEEKLPILQQPSEKVVASTKEVVSSTVNGAKDAVASSMSGVVVMTRSVVSGSVNTVMGSRVGQMVANGVDAVLDMSEDLVDHYLPVTEQELIEMAASLDCSEPDHSELATPKQPNERQSYFVRLGSLSSKVRHRAYQHSLGKLKNARQGTQDALAQLSQTIELIEHIKQGVDQKIQSAQEKLHQMWLQWSQKDSPETSQKDAPQPEIESQALEVSRDITQQLHSTTAALVSNLQGLPAGIQEKVTLVRQNVEELRASFLSAKSFQDLSSSILAQSKERVSQARELTDEVLEHVTRNAPVSWLVGPFAPSGKPEKEEIEMQ